MSYLTKIPVKPALIGAGLTLTALASFNWVSAKQFGLRETLFSLVGKTTLQPGIYPQVPFAQYTHTYSSNTQRISFNAGSLRFWPLASTTSDKNALTSELSLNYRVLQDPKKLAFHRWAMEGFIMADGYWLITDLLNTSANAVLGRKSMAENIANPDAYIKAVFEDFKFRLEQNNVPIEIESIELKEFRTSLFTRTHTVSYNVVKENHPLTPQP